MRKERTPEDLHILALIDAHSAAVKARQRADSQRTKLTMTLGFVQELCVVTRDEEDRTCEALLAALRTRSKEFANV